MSIDLVIDVDHGKGEFIASIKLNAKNISGRNVIIVFRLSRFQCKKENDEILGNTDMVPIWDRINNIFAGIFLGWKCEGKTQFRILTHGFSYSTTKGKNNIKYIQDTRFCHWRPIFLCHIPWKGGSLPTLII